MKVPSTTFPVKRIRWLVRWVLTTFRRSLTIRRPWADNRNVGLMQAMVSEPYQPCRLVENELVQLLVGPTRTNVVDQGCRDYEPPGFDIGLKLPKRAHVVEVGLIKRFD
jgi:hypothetical protein